jgi:Uma2 family endonuclease
MMSAESGVMTADDLLRLPSDGWLYELVRGELRRVSPPGHQHGRVAAEILTRITEFVREGRLGETYAAETGFLLRRAPDTVRAPDAAFVSASRLASILLPPGGYFPGPPDLAVEVTLPSDTYSEVEEKVASWLEAGCRVVVVLDPQRQTAKVYRPHGEVLALAEG